MAEREALASDHHLRETEGLMNKLGFWFAQQGSIYVFVVLIFVYVWLMNRLDKKFDVDEE